MTETPREQEPTDREPPQPTSGAPAVPAAPTPVSADGGGAPPPVPSGQPVYAPMPVPVVRRVAPPQAAAAIPWASPVLLALFLGGVWLFFHHGRDVFAATSIAAFDLHDPSTWYRLVAALFVHGKNHELQAIIVVPLVLYNGFRSERALGAGGMLACFLVGGVVGNLVRTLGEPPALLQASAGTTAGAVALIGAAASTAVRTRTAAFVSAIFSALGSLFVTTLFSGGAQLGASLGHVAPMLPATGTAFIVGGFLGATLPLYDPAKRRAFRGVLLVLGLALLGWAGYRYAAVLTPILHPSGPPGPDALKKKAADEPLLEMTSDPRLGYDVGVPLGHHKLDRDDEQGNMIVIVPNISSLPIIKILTQRRNKDPRFSADGIAFEQANSLVKQFPDAKPIEEGWIENCPLGPAYRHVLRMRQDQTAFDAYICVVQAEDDFVTVFVQADPEDTEAPALVEAVVRSLKVHSASTDKKDGGRSR